MISIIVKLEPHLELYGADILAILCLSVFIRISKNNINLSVDTRTRTYINLKQGMRFTLI